ncbi:MAG: MBL fold metallo-hydrolase [Nitrospira sp.]|nr:MAG: MBL fold metallo-hydrolase [Nitrospira sp.]
MDIHFYGATREVTGSCYLLRVGEHHILVDCGLIQGNPQHEEHNRDPFPFEPSEIDAVVLTHAHLDHSGRLPLLVKQGFKGPIHTHRATADLCRIMLEDAGYLNEKDAAWDNRKRERQGKEPVSPLYTQEEARLAHTQFRALEYGKTKKIVPGIKLTLLDAGHILGSAIVKLELKDGNQRRVVVLSGDLGHSGAPILRDPEPVRQADLVVMESTYGNRQHRPWDATWQEMGEILSRARADKGNVLIPAFAVGRTQELLYVFKQHYQEWGLDDWQIFLDSPMAIKATRVYQRHGTVYDARARQILEKVGDPFAMPNLTMSRHSTQSMAINKMDSGAIIIAGSGMCTGGRITHHLKHNAWRKHAHILIVGFQAAGTRGRALVDGADEIHLWGEPVKVKAQVHTIGGLSAHADQKGLMDWYGRFDGRPRVALVHGEPESMQTLASRLHNELQAEVMQPEFGARIDLTRL